MRCGSLDSRYVARRDGDVSVTLYPRSFGSEEGEASNYGSN